MVVPFFVFNSNDHSVTCNKMSIFTYMFLLHASCDYLTRNRNIQVTIYCGIMVFCNGTDYSITCSKLSLVYFLCQLAERSSPFSYSF